MAEVQLSGRRVSAVDLNQFVIEVLQSVGVGPDNARTTADVLVMTDTWGVFTHGVKALRGYVRRLRAGGLRPNAKPHIVSEGPAWAIVDGDSGLGMVTSVFAMQTAIAKAKACGLGYAGVRNSCHFGAAGYYAALAAGQDLLGMAMANDTPSVTAPGARGAITGSNPLAYGVPTGSGRPLMLDMATSVVAGGKVAAAHDHGKQIPADWVIDRDGLSSTDPNAFLKGGALKPMAGHKGYGIALLIESLAGVLTGAGLTRQILPWIISDPTSPTHHGAAFMAFDVGAMEPIDQFKSRIDHVIDEIRQAPKAPGAERIYLPGDFEWENRERALAEGILLPGDVVASLQGLAGDLNFDLASRLPEHK
jgi:LDH2 family malate/lactate/ureidoglycolate dehydrogenase